ncbi:MAG TPA: energy-coupling factor ABC transporter ATP-binding protein, partial [Clostridiales bacterium]|nr:energy-coupling factor ABC transporter ATP-binding protein [Clostridiales bacterium]
FELSGGQKRRVAIAGVIAMRPRVLILDEPTAGLDPRGKKEILNLIKKLKETSSPTVIIISHDMDAVAENCDKVAFFSGGEILAEGAPRDLFYDDDLLARTEMEAPAIVKLTKALENRGVTLDSHPINKQEFVQAVKRWRDE